MRRTTCEKIYTFRYDDCEYDYSNGLFISFKKIWDISHIEYDKVNSSLDDELLVDVYLNQYGLYDIIHRKEQGTYQNTLVFIDLDFEYTERINIINKYSSNRFLSAKNILLTYIRDQKLNKLIV